MGQCASPPPRKKTTHLHDREPADTESYKNKQLPKLHFQAVLANVKLKKYPFVTLFSLSPTPSPYLKLEKAKVSPYPARKLPQMTPSQYFPYHSVEVLLKIRLSNDRVRTTQAIPGGGHPEWTQVDSGCNSNQPFPDHHGAIPPGLRCQSLK